MNPISNKSEILARVTLTRALLSEDLGDLGRALDVPNRLRSSYRLHPLAWVAGAVAAGMAAASLFRGNGNSGGLAKWRPLLLGTLGFLGNRALTLSLPTLQEMLETELTRWLDGRGPMKTEAESQGG